LLEIGRRLAAGERPGKAIRALRQTACGEAVGDKLKEMPEGLVAEVLGALQANDLGRFRQLLDTARHAAPASVFISELAAPLTAAVGNAWLQGTLSISAEHYFSHCLRQALASYGRLSLLEQSRPRVLLANFSGEQHTLGLAMLDAALQDAGVPTVMLEGDLPVAELVVAAMVYKVSALAISASVAFSPKALSVMASSLRQQLPAGIDLWLGGMGSRKLGCLPPGIQVMEQIEEAVVSSRAMQFCGRPATIQEQRR